MTLDVQEVPRRRVAVARHHGPEASVDETRRPLYQHLIMHELVGGPPMLRFPDGAGPEGPVDVLVATTEGFEGDDVVAVEVLAGGWYATRYYEGPAAALPAARARFLADVEAAGHGRAGDLLQVHLMDEIEGTTEQQFQMAVT